ncbi:hypothetical protein [Pedobacter gandavensis]|uniref:YybH family protein n=1 Tax=Pedobacter gandavensis TaxID=2679963 RepID=UPI00292FBC4C|nr:hypothetical protein [Pedobacter gandavensis]
MEEVFNRKTQIGAVGFFRNCLKNRDLKGAMSCFDPQGLYIDSDGTEIRGQSQIEAAIAQLCALSPEIKGGQAHVSTIGDLSLWMDEWGMTAAMPNGHVIKSTGHTACLMKRNEQGLWLWLVDNPFGSAVLKAKVS